MPMTRLCGIDSKLLKGGLILHSFNDKPSMIHAAGSFAWYKNGIKHRDNNEPAYINHEGDFDIYNDGELLCSYKKVKSDSKSKQFGTWQMIYSKCFGYLN